MIFAINPNNESFERTGKAGGRGSEATVCVRPGSLDEAANGLARMVIQGEIIPRGGSASG